MYDMIYGVLKFRYFVWLVPNFLLQKACRQKLSTLREKMFLGYRVLPEKSA